MGLAVTVACGSVRLARWCFLGASSVVLVAQMARTTRRGRVRVLGRVLGRVQGSRMPPPSQAQIVSSSSKFKNDPPYYTGMQNSEAATLSAYSD